MENETICIPKEKLIELEKKAELNDELLIKLVRGLEDIKHGRVKLWEKSTH